jgi:hypothetical protein
MLAFADPKEWWLEITAVTETAAQQQSQQCTTTSSSHRAYLNTLCLNTVLNWLQTDASEAHSWEAAAAFPCPGTNFWPAFWDLVNGSVINLGHARLVLIPSEVIDDSELEVPQEWVDIPNWAGDYYLAVQVQPDHGLVRVWGYATHQELKAAARYDANDRTYCLDREHLTQDLNAFWVTYQFCANLQTKAAIAPLPELSSVQAENLIQRVANSNTAFPRLSVPFSLWGALMQQDHWRQALYQVRRGEAAIAPLSSSVIRLRDWFQGQFTDLWQTVDTVLSPQQVAVNWRGVAQPETLSEATESTINRAKILDVGSQPGEAQIALLLALTPLDATNISIGVRISPVGNAAYLPHDVQVRLLDDTGTEIGQARASVTEIIQLRFNVTQGEQFSIEITSGGTTITESFEI